MEKLLQNYPFTDPRVQLVEGFSAYDGVIGDTPDQAHNGIDYVLCVDNSYRSFAVTSMHDGLAFQGSSKTWGKFVIVYKVIDKKRYSTIYAHLAEVAATIPMQFLEETGKRVLNKSGLAIQAGESIGIAGKTGLTNNVIQLHIELHAKNLITGLNRKLDPYGLNDRASSGRYPQPGKSLSGLNHFWINDQPQTHFASDHAE